MLGSSSVCICEMNGGIYKCQTSKELRSFFSFLAVKKIAFLCRKKKKSLFSVLALSLQSPLVLSITLACILSNKNNPGTWEACCTRPKGVDLCCFCYFGTAVSEPVVSFVR
jgi:predicted permease